MLTGPVTMLQWSFVRDDQPRADTALQIALAIRDEVADLETAGIGIIQIDEPALREGLAAAAQRSGTSTSTGRCARFRVAPSGVRDDDADPHPHVLLGVQRHPAGDRRARRRRDHDRDVALGHGAAARHSADFDYPNEIGPGVYDIHSPRVPRYDGDAAAAAKRAASVIPAGTLWVNPDCGLKTRGWPETESALRHMVEAASIMRERYRESAAA